MATAQQYTAPESAAVLPHQAAFCRAWHVLHACDDPQAVDGVVRAQIEAGMYANVVVPPDAAPPSISLLNAWNDVRHWRKLLLEGGAESTEIIHAHGFRSGMAAVRNWSGVVYDIDAFVESAAAAGVPGPNIWLGRSFRVAEQFVLSRAGAVVVHSYRIRAGVLERGAAAENVFLIPAPILCDTDSPVVHHRPSPVPSYFVTDLPAGAERTNALQTMIQAAAIVDREVGPASWWLDAELTPELLEQARLLGIDFHTGAPREAIQRVDVVISFGGADGAMDNGTLCAMKAGRALLAADVDGNRDATPEGAGCLWFHPGHMRELAGRAVFLARNPEFGRALGDAGRRYISESRTPLAIALQYDAAYRHAFARKRNPPQPHVGALQPLQCLL